MDTFMQALIEKIVNSSDFIALVAATFKQWDINVFEEELRQEPPVKKKIFLPPKRSASASARTTSYNDSKPDSLVADYRIERSKTL